jgi:hypothetical protein
MIFNNQGLSTATMATRTRLNVTLYVQVLSYVQPEDVHITDVHITEVHITEVLQIIYINTLSDILIYRATKGYLESFALQVFCKLHLSIAHRPYHGSGGYSSASHRGGPGSIPGQSMWDL